MKFENKDIKIDYTEELRFIFGDRLKEAYAYIYHYEYKGEIYPSKEDLKKTYVENGTNETIFDISGMCDDDGRLHIIFHDGLHFTVSASEWGDLRLVEELLK